MQTKRKNHQHHDHQADEAFKELVSYCPFCRHSFSPRKAAVIGESGESWLLHVTCEQCASSIVMLLMVGEMGVSSFGLLTDLNESEVERFQSTGAVSGDDLIELYQLLHGGRFDFASLI